MFKNLSKNLNSYLKFTDEEKTFFLSLFEYKKMKKYDHIVKAGEICRYVAYVNKGLFRYYFIAGSKEHTTRIFMEDSWASDYVSFLCHKESEVNIEALEDSELFIVNDESMQRAYDKAKIFERFGRLMAESLFIDIVSRNTNFLRKTPEERYLDMLEQTPQIFNRVSLKYIASIIGIEPESLSRIRKRTAGR